ncbi:hypothetical protein UFOVP116_385 [uncultured Caudovirales phage]|uniref:Uncharacterized protein n=1 Tax=uncultured Caudovirales phage TaxID=2100421 RepID=A0A6J5L7E4_9CAUD|nr:hypothetical protein UFOVP116_385 [uncultured Caudovirales phage]
MATRKPKTQQSKLNLSLRDKWQHIIKDVSKPDVPINMLERIIVHLVDGTKVNVDISGLLSEGGDPDIIEQHIQAKLNDLDAYIADIDLYVDFQEVAKTVQPLTDKILSKL